MNEPLCIFVLFSFFPFLLLPCCLSSVVYLSVIWAKCLHEYHKMMGAQYPFLRDMSAQMLPRCSMVSPLVSSRSNGSSRAKKFFQNPTLCQQIHTHVSTFGTMLHMLVQRSSPFFPGERSEAKHNTVPSIKLCARNRPRQDRNYSVLRT
ncbi:hypothetical protein DFS34DRAFT_607534 [Phlyctochytrium arcticum]|nr:hypothetical protein DFS34DRAFT_607534 [Phlyctochytrium arcticum]